MTATSRLAAVLALVLGLTACSVGADRDPVDHAALLGDLLSADGEAPDVVDCVVTIGAVDLERGPLDQLAIDELLAGCRSAQLVIDPAADDPLPPAELLLAEVPWTFGDDPSLDRLWTACEEGSGAACDELFEASAVGSEYEDFGVSCGRRDELLHCAELDVEEQDEG